MSADPPDDLLDRLYGLPLDEFIGERDAAAKALRKEKRREEATAVGKLRRPSVAAGLVNRLAREERKAVDALLAAGEALRAAQDEAVAGRGADELRTAGQREQEAVQALVRAARGLEPGDDEGKAPSDDVLDRVRETLHAAASDPAVRADVDAGRLTKEVEGGGAWPFMADAPEPPDPPARKRSPGRKGNAAKEETTDRDAAAEREAAAERKAAERERRRELAAAQKEQTARRRERERAERRAQAAQEKATEAAAAAETAAEELDEARAAEEAAAARAAELEDD